MKKTFLISSNNSYFNIELFYRSVKTTLYRRKGFTPSKLQPSLSVNGALSRLLKKNFPLSIFKLITFTTLNLNKQINRKILAFLYTKTKQFKNNIFIRRFTLYIDFLKYQRE